MSRQQLYRRLAAVAAIATVIVVSGAGHADASVGAVFMNWKGLWTTTDALTQFAHVPSGCPTEGPSVDGGCLLPALAPDGDTLAYKSDLWLGDGLGYQGTVHIRHLASGTDSALYQEPSGYYIQSLTISPDAETLIAALDPWDPSDPATPETRLIAIPADGTPPKALYTVAADVYLGSIAFTGDGNSIFFIAGDDAGVAHVLRADADGTEVTPIELPDTTTFWYGPIAVSPDGKFLALQADDDSYPVHVLDVTHGDLAASVPLLSGPPPEGWGRDEEPLGWAPDGQHVLIVVHTREYSTDEIDVTYYNFDIQTGLATELYSGVKTPTESPPWWANGIVDPAFRPGSVPGIKLDSESDGEIATNSTGSIRIPVSVSSPLGLSSVRLTDESGNTVDATGPPCESNCPTHLSTTLTASTAPLSGSGDEGRLHLQVHVVDGGGGEQVHRFDLVVDHSAPADPTGLAETMYDAESGELDLSWDDQDDPNLADGSEGSGVETSLFRVRRNGGSWGSWSETGGDSAEIEDASVGDTIDIEYRAVDTAGNASAVVDGSVSVEEPAPSRVAASDPGADPTNRVITTRDPGPVAQIADNHATPPDCGPRYKDRARYTLFYVVRKAPKKNWTNPAVRYHVEYRTRVRYQYAAALAQMRLDGRRPDPDANGKYIAHSPKKTDFHRENVMPWYAHTQIEVAPGSEVEIFARIDYAPKTILDSVYVDPNGDTIRNWLTATEVEWKCVA